MSAAELLSEWLSTSMAATRSDFEALIARGVSPHWLWLGTTRFGVCKIEPHSDGTYEPRPGGLRAYIVPLIPLAPDTLIEHHDLGDLIAFTLDAPETWWCCYSTIPLLNPEAAERARWFREPLHVWRTPLDWLRAQGSGSVILDWRASLRLWLDDVPEIIAQDLVLGERIERRLVLPRARTRILVQSQDPEAA